jgi:hypothetical protein|tara:strand:- start:93994 stop:94272 length:279 start_codon:yes stop_codon:yes gene_type:complete
MSMAKVIIETVVTQTFKRVYELDIEDGVDAKEYVESGQSLKEQPLASHEFEPEGEDVVKVVSIVSVAELEKQKADDEKAQLKRELNKNLINH